VVSPSKATQAPSMDILHCARNGPIRRLGAALPKFTMTWTEPKAAASITLDQCLSVVCRPHAQQKSPMTTSHMWNHQAKRTDANKT
jgi:hypothetical protein